MRITTLSAGIACLAATFIYIAIGIEFAIGSPVPLILSWWWRNGDRESSLLLCALGFVVFPLLFALWGRNCFRLIRARAFGYVWLGPTLERNKGYFFALDDPHRKRVVLSLRMPKCGHDSGTRTNSLCATKYLFGLGSDPGHAVETASLRPGAQARLLLAQYLALGFGLAAANDVVYPYIEARGQLFTASLLPISALLTLMPLLCLHLLGTTIGYIAFRKKITTWQALDRSGILRPGLTPGDKISVRLVERRQKTASTDCTRFTNLYRVEWTSEAALTLSAVLALRTTSEHQAAIEELDRMTDAQDEIHCLVADNFKLRPSLLAEMEGIDWL